MVAFPHQGPPSKDTSGNASENFETRQPCTFFGYPHGRQICVVHLIEISTNLFIELAPFANKLFKLTPVFVLCDTSNTILHGVDYDFSFHTVHQGI